jgi:sirohydrochlorin ferrochelatase
MTGIVLFAHGSTVESANDAVRAVTAKLSQRTGDLVETAFLDCAPPKLPDAVAALAAKGVSRIVVIPYFLTLGIHLQRDLPRIAEELRRIYQGVSIEITEPLDGHPALVEILTDRWKNARHES